MKKIIIGIMMLLLIIQVSAQINIQTATVQTQEVINTKTDGIINMSESPRITFYSIELKKNITRNFEGTDRYNQCKANSGLLYVGDVLSFNCTDYVDYDDYLEKKMEENVESLKTSPPSDVSGLQFQVESLELLIQQLLSRIEVLEAMLNITEEPAQTPLYSCPGRADEECPGGLSKLNAEGLQTRCYNPFLIGWKNCKTGWTLK